MPRKLIYFIGTFVLVFAAGVFIAVPVWLDDFVSRELQSFSSYHASYSGISFSLSTGKYSISNLTLKSASGRINQPLFVAKSVELGLSLKHLFRGKITGEVILNEPTLTFISAPSAEGSQLETDYPWGNVGKRLLGIPLNDIQINNGAIVYRDLQSSPNVLLVMDKIFIQVSNLEAGTETEELSGIASGSADIHNGKLTFDLLFKPQSTTPVFNLKARLENFDLSYLIDYLRGSGNYTIEKGMFSMVTQASGEAQNISGFVKPLLETIQLASINDEKRALPWKNVRSPFNKSFPQMSFHGTLDDSGESVWGAVAFTIRDAFFEALTPVIRKINSKSKGRDRDRRVLLAPRKSMSA